MMKRPHKMFALSLASHTAAAALLWFAALDLVAVEMPEPTVIETTILPPPAEPKLAPEPEKTTPTPVIINNIVRKTPVDSKGDNEKLNGGGQQKGSPTKVDTTNNNGALGDAGNSAKGNAPSDGAAASSDGVAAAPKPLKGAPVDVSIKEGGFKIKYEVTASYKGIDAGGGATFTFRREGSTYEAALISHAAVADFGAVSKGEIRSNTVATTSFRDWRKIGLLGMGKEKPSSNFMINYVERQANFDSAGGPISLLEYDAVYDYLSAMVYIQAVLQTKQGVDSLKLPIGKRKNIEIATVTFGAPGHLSVGNGAFEDAIPATIVIPNGSIKSIKMWFVPEKEYLPLEIDIGFNAGYVKLIARE